MNTDLRGKLIALGQITALIAAIWYGFFHQTGMNPIIATLAAGFVYVFTFSLAFGIGPIGEKIWKAIEQNNLTWLLLVILLVLLVANIFVPAFSQSFNTLDVFVRGPAFVLAVISVIRIGWRIRTRRIKAQANVNKT